MAYPSRVCLTNEQPAWVRTLIGWGKVSARSLTWARVLLKADQGKGGRSWSVTAIAAAVDVHLAIIYPDPR